MKKPIFILAMGLLAFMSANAKGEKSDNSKTTEVVAAPAETKTTATLNHYYVVDQAGSNYVLSTDPSENDNCGSGSLPCEISTSQTLGTTVPKSQVDGQVNITIDSRRPSFD